MKKITILMVLAVVFIISFAFAQATSETGDTRARPVTCYGKQSNGTVTAILVDADGIVQTR